VSTPYPPAPLEGEPPEPEGLTLRDYLAVMWRRKWLIFLVTVVAAGAAYFFADRQPDRYKATADLIYEAQIDVSNPLNPYTYNDPNERALEMRAIADVLASPDMIRRGEGLLKDRYGDGFTSNRDAGSSSADGDDKGGDGLPDYTVTSQLPDDTASTTTQSNVVSIIGDSTDARLASAAANAYADAYVAWREERQKEQIAKAIAIVEEQMSNFSEAAKATSDYAILQERLRDLQILAGTATGNFRVLVPAQKPDAPYEPRPLRSGALGLGVGLFAGIGLAFLFEQFDTRIRRQDEVTRILRQPVLGLIPRISSKLLGESALVTLRHPDGHVAETFRMIRTNLDFMNVDDEVKSLLITSCAQGEGKSVAVANLAVAMALGGKKVVVVDGDLRAPRQHTYFHIANEVGVSTVVTGKTPLAEALVQVGVVPREAKGEGFVVWAQSTDACSHLYVLPSGPLPPNPGEIVASRRFAQMLRAVEKEADVVLVDSPAMLAVGDTAALAAKVDGLVFLVDMNVARRPVLEQAAEQLAKLPVAFLGVILRADGVHGGRYGYSYGSHYGYYDEYGRDGDRRRQTAGDRRRGESPSHAERAADDERPAHGPTSDAHV